MSELDGLEAKVIEAKKTLDENFNYYRSKLSPVKALISAFFISLKTAGVDQKTLEEKPESANLAQFDFEHFAKQMEKCLNAEDVPAFDEAARALGLAIDIEHSEFEFIFIENRAYGERVSRFLDKARFALSIYHSLLFILSPFEKTKSELETLHQYQLNFPDTEKLSLYDKQAVYTKLENKLIALYNQFTDENKKNETYYPKLLKFWADCLSKLNGLFNEAHQQHPNRGYASKVNWLYYSPFQYLLSSLKPSLLRAEPALQNVTETLDCLLAPEGIINRYKALKLEVCELELAALKAKIRLELVKEGKSIALDDCRVDLKQGLGHYYLLFGKNPNQGQLSYENSSSAGQSSTFA